MSGDESRRRSRRDERRKEHEQSSLRLHVGRGGEARRATRKVLSGIHIQLPRGILCQCTITFGLAVAGTVDVPCATNQPLGRTHLRTHRSRMYGMPGCAWCSGGGARVRMKNMNETPGSPPSRAELVSSRYNRAIPCSLPWAFPSWSFGRRARGDATTPLSRLDRLRRPDVS